ncbi:MAG: hypothetical protein GYA48_15360 [Chloroflexi bacterium]|nr:hypothetical protein [Chloroflexota bacterium]
MKKSYALIFSIALSILFSACAPSEEQLQEIVSQTIAAYTPIPTNTPYSTFTPYPTSTAYPTLTAVIQTVIVTPTETPTPEYTPTITATATSTLNPLQTNKGPGFYLVGIDIAPGIWRSQGASDGCYWSINTKTGDIIKNHFGMAGGTMYINPSAFQVELNADCGEWVYLGQ